MGNSVTLSQFAPKLQQHGAVLDRGHALGDHLPAQGRGQPEDAAEDGQIVRVVEHVADEALVDLELRHRQAFQVGQRRVASAEVVERETDADLRAGFDDLRNTRQVFEGAGFQHFHFQIARTERRVRGDQRVQALDEIRLLQLARADIDADRGLQSGVAPGFELCQGGIDDPFADFDRQRMIFDDRQEHAGRQQPTFRMLPADQCFGADDVARAHIDLRLVVEDELLRRQRAPDVFQAFVMAAQAAILLGVEDVEAVLARELGLIHRLVGLP